MAYLIFSDISIENSINYFFFSYIITHFLSIGSCRWTEVIYLMVISSPYLTVNHVELIPGNIYFSCSINDLKLISYHVNLSFYFVYFYKICTYIMMKNITDGKVTGNYYANLLNAL